MMNTAPPSKKIDQQESKPTEYIWQDREIRFDSKANQLACRRGEKVIDSINSVEDTKGDLQNN